LFLDHRLGLWSRSWRFTSTASPSPLGDALCSTSGLELQQLNPNDIQQMATFQALCEGY
jgi:hypothetical protein